MKLQERAERVIRKFMAHNNLDSTTVTDFAVRSYAQEIVDTVILGILEEHFRQSNEDEEK